MFGSACTRVKLSSVLAPGGRKKIKKKKKKKKKTREKK